jgi:hypothetical protein
MMHRAEFSQGILPMSTSAPLHQPAMFGNYIYLSTPYADRMQRFQPLNQPNLVLIKAGNFLLGDLIGA